SDAENNLRLIQALGDDLQGPGTRFDWIEEGEKEAINRELDSVISGHNGPLVVLSPGTKRPSRAWPPQNFTEVAVKLNMMYGAKIIVVGTETQKSLNEKICNGHPFMVDFSGKTSIHGLAYVLSKSDLVISVDSGPMHVAAAVGVPVVAIFGPGDYKVWKPYCKNPHVVSILRQPPPCAPCLHYQCPRENHECMEAISVEAVFSEAERLLRMTGKVTVKNSMN
ncbi:MAG: hypothetical protein DRH15_11630, partial [Deltaproteobacteria bacterium]